jgi:hypothetical protein
VFVTEFDLLMFKRENPLTTEDIERITRKLDIFIDDVYKNCFTDKDILLMLYLRLKPTFDICFRQGL